MMSLVLVQQHVRGGIKTLSVLQTLRRLPTFHYTRHTAALALIVMSHLASALCTTAFSVFELGQNPSLHTFVRFCFYPVQHNRCLNYCCAPSVAAHAYKSMHLFTSHCGVMRAPKRNFLHTVRLYRANSTFFCTAHGQIAHRSLICHYHVSALAQQTVRINRAVMI